MSKKDFKVYLSEKKEVIVEVKNAENSQEALRLALRWRNNHHDEIETVEDYNVYSSEGVNKIYSELYPETDYEDLASDIIIDAEKGESEE